MKGVMMFVLSDLEKRMPVKYNDRHCYDIVYSTNFDELADELKKFNVSRKRLCIVSESNVAPIYGDVLIKLLKPICKDVFLFEFKAGEAQKNLDTVGDIYSELISHHFDRYDMLIALGGGVTGDITGFVASTYLRGIDFIQVPTSLLAQVDSSIGGKTGVDFKAYKNMIGAFYMPKLVYMNLSALKTLPMREYVSGMAEILKHGLIKDNEYFGWLVENRKEIMERNIDVIRKMIVASCAIKRDVVENDPKEKGERALLNFGHTIGHAVEKVKNFELLHGECVSIGIAAASYISKTRGYISNSDYEKIILALKYFGLPVTTDDLDVKEVLETTASDKKMVSGKLRFVVLKSIGKAQTDESITRDELKNAIEKVAN